MFQGIIPRSISGITCWSLPQWLQWFVNINPISHLVTAVRELVNHGTIGGGMLISLVGAAVIVAVFAPITVRAYMRRT